MQSEFLLISHVARPSFTSQWLKIFSESLVIKVSNSNSKEEQLRIVHHDASCIMYHWWAASHEPHMVWSGFAAWNFVFEILFLQSFVSVSGLGRGPGAELHSDGPGFGVERRHRPWNPWGPVFPGERYLLRLELGSAVSQSPASRVLQKPPSQGHGNLQKHVM